MCRASRQAQQGMELLVQPEAGMTAGQVMCLDN